MTLQEAIKDDTKKVKKKQKKKAKGGKQDILSVYFGVPGSGKTTFAAWLAKRYMKRGYKVWSNVPITGTYKLDAKADIGTFMIDNGLIIIDEAGIEFNNREYKSFPQKCVEFFKYHRHYETEIVVFSQSYDDMDITLRRLAQRLYVVKKSIFKWFVSRQRIGKRVGINEVSKEIIDEYFFVPLGRRYIFCPVLWRMFNTLSRKEYPEKEWEIW